LSVTIRVPLRVPTLTGAKVTLMAQLAPTATVVPQVLVWAKLPLVVMLPTLRAAVPVLLRVTTWAALVVPVIWPAKVRLTDATLACGEMPVPERIAVWALVETPFELSATVRVALRAPLAVGLKLTVTAQLAPAATDAPHVLVATKSPLLAPETATLATAKAAVPVLLRVSVCTALVVPKI
jgi:hypothetical protein